MSEGNKSSGILGLAFGLLLLVATIQVFLEKILPLLLMWFLILISGLTFLAFIVWSLSFALGFDIQKWANNILSKIRKYRFHDNNKSTYYSNSGNYTDALMLFDLKEPYTLQELKSRRNDLLKRLDTQTGAYHGLAVQINAAFDLLKSRI